MEPRQNPHRVTYRPTCAENAGEQLDEQLAPRAQAEDLRFLGSEDAWEVARTEAMRMRGVGTQCVSCNKRATRCTRRAGADSWYKG